MGWLNTGHQRQRVTPGTDSRCPSCGQEDKTQDHVLQCRDRRIKKARYQAGIKLRTSIVTSKGGSITWTVLHQCIMGWLESNLETTTVNLDRVQMPSALRPLLIHAMAAQEQIGWKYAVRGYLSLAWIDAQSLEHPQSTQQGLRTQWLSPIIQQLWVLYINLWKARNNILHGVTKTTQSI